MLQSVLPDEIDQLYAILSQLSQGSAPAPQYETAFVDSIRLLEHMRQRSLELEEANDELHLLYRVGEAINAANTFDEVLKAVSGIISGDTAAGLYFWEGWNFEDATYVELAAATGHLIGSVGRQVPKEALPYTRNDPHERLMIIEDVAADTRLDPMTVANYLVHDLHAVISIRLFVNERWIGALVFQSSTPRVFSIRERRMVVGVGDYVRGAVERIRLQQETEAARHAAEVFARQAKQLAALEERTRLARELHDSVSQVLYSISLWGHSARAFMKHDPSRVGESVDYILSLAEVGLSEMRTLIFELRPESLEEEGLVSALSKQADSLQARHGVQITSALCEEPSLPLEVKADLYRIAREALHNAIKHAQASHITLSLMECPPGYCLEITDNGQGFDATMSFPGHFGLKSMRERTESFSGAFYIQSAPGKGTKIVVTV